MKIIKPSAKIIIDKPGIEMLQAIERAGRTCYKSEDKITFGSAEEFVKMIIKRGHDSVLEHEKITARVICDRGVTHEIVRHRIGASYSQESTRYCNYEGKDMEFIYPCWFDYPNTKQSDKNTWESFMSLSENYYNKLINSGWFPQQARSVLPNSLKTEIVITMNLRAWRHFFTLRCAKAAHPQMREIALKLLIEMCNYIPVVFDDLYEKFILE